MDGGVHFFKIAQNVCTLCETIVPIVETLPISRSGWRMIAATDVKEGVGWWYVNQAIS